MAIGVVLALVFIFSEAALTGTVGIMWLPAWLTFGFTLIRELIKDVEDISGDKIDGARTFPVVFGVEKTLFLVYLLIITLCVLCWIPYLNNIYGTIYAFCLLFTVEIPLILSIFFLRKNPTSSGCAMISRATKWITLGGMVTILCSSL